MPFRTNLVGKTVRIYYHDRNRATEGSWEGGYGRVVAVRDRGRGFDSLEALVFMSIGKMLWWNVLDLRLVSRRGKTPSRENDTGGWG